MSAVPKSFVFTSTTSYVAVSGYDANTRYNGIAVQNDTDGTIAIAVGSQDYADLHVMENHDVALDNFPLQGTMYIKNLTGTGGDVVVTVWVKDK